MAPNRRPHYTPAQYDNVLFHNKYVQVYLYIGLLSILFLAISANVAGQLASRRRRRRAARYAQTVRPSARCARTGKGCTRWIPGTLLAGVRRWAYRKSSVALFFGMSNLGEFLIIAGYCILNLVLVGVGAGGHVDYMAHHAARLANANLPLVIGLASKNNVISYATGLSYESLNVFHRWVARLVLLLSTIHVAGRIYINYPAVIFDGSPPPNSPRGYLYAGAIGYGLFALMVVGASRWLRNKYYQFFIITHVASFIFTLIAISIHRPSIAGWLFAGFAIYFLDRIVRTGRILLDRRVVGAEVEGEEEVAGGEVMDIGGGCLRVNVRSRLRWVPGQHVYLHVPLLSAGGHPFSICSIAKPMVASTKSSVSTAEPIATIVLLIRVRAGLTGRLYDLTQGDLESPPSSTRSHAISTLSTVSTLVPRQFPTVTVSPLWTEGPYGLGTQLDYYQTVLLVAGGSGVSFTLPLMLDLVRRRRGMLLEAGWGRKEGEDVATERLTFIWIVRDVDHVEWIGDALREAIDLAPPGFLNVQVHITSKSFVAPPAPPCSKIQTVEKPAAAKMVREEIFASRRVPFGISMGVSEVQAMDKRYEGEKTEGMDRIVEIDNEDDSSTISPSHQFPPMSPLTRAPPVHTLFTSSTIPLYAGRPNLSSILEREIESTDFSDYLCVGTCGPSAMTSELASCVSEAIELSKVMRGELRRNIRLHCEEYGW